MCRQKLRYPLSQQAFLSKKLRFPLSQQESYVMHDDLNQSETTATCKVVSCTELRIILVLLLLSSSMY